MRKPLLSVCLVIFIVIPVSGLSNELVALDIVDGFSGETGNFNLPGNTFYGADGKTIDIVGDSTSTGGGSGRAKGNSYQVDMDITLTEAEFWLIFSDSQTLTYYVFVCPTEFGTYNEVYRNSQVVAGSGAGWYSSGTISVDMDAGYHYIIAVSWDGYTGYCYGSGDSQATSFGAQTYGYATGNNPLPASFVTSINDQAIYYQRLNTVDNTALDMSTWGAVKSLF